MSPLFLYNTFIIPIVQSEGMIPDSNTRLKINTITFITFSGQFFMNSFKIQSIPGDLFF